MYKLFCRSAASVRQKEKLMQLVLQQAVRRQDVIYGFTFIVPEPRVGHIEEKREKRQEGHLMLIGML